MTAPDDGKAHEGFTLIELSIVLVVIGLIVGGVLAGQSLISAAGMRATISQIEKYNTAANTFREKYGYLPGDIPAVPAAQFGFQARGSCPGEGDGNGIIEGSLIANCAAYPSLEIEGETVVFWVDLSAAHLIDGSFNTASEIVSPGIITAASTPGIGQFFPAAKLGRGNYIYVYAGASYNSGPNGLNYYGMSAITQVGATMNSAPGLTVGEAYAIDTKIDDGLPQRGRVTATYINDAAETTGWSQGLAFTQGAAWPNPLTSTAAQSGSATTCWDNGGNAGMPQAYSVEISGGSNVTCALSFQMQAGD